MSHLINFDELDGDLFVLQQLVLASENYCAQEMIGSELDIGNGKFDVYWGWIKGIVSDYLIGSAIKTRIFQDYLSEGENKIELDLDLTKADLDARNNLKIGIIHEGNFELTLRESCNKIIHAKKSIPSWSEKTINGIVFKYWNGSFHLHGSKGNQNWHLELSVGDWAKAMSLYHDMLDSSEGRIYVGQDW